jgi:TonB-linked SusC/RagA family outer membrane protein
MEFKLIKCFFGKSQKKLLMLLMKTFIFLLCTTVMAFSSSNSFSQKKVTIKTNQIITVDEVFDIIKKQTNYRFVYPQNLFNNTPKVTLKKGVITVDKLLNQMLSKEKFSITLEDNNRINIKKRQQSQQRQITGSITNENGVSLPGASIVIKGKNKGTSANLNGDYNIIASSEDVLVFSSLGYIKKEITVGVQNKINVVLKEATNKLEEVVINAGYYKTSKREATSSISTVTAKDIEKQPVSNPLAALQGRMAGVFITQKSGVVGGGFDIKIRGRNSLRHDGNNPLYIIDGVPFTSTSIKYAFIGGSMQSGTNPLNNINPSDIESIDILKDADATSIYGSRGANGVVLITTKKGKTGKTKFNIHMQSGVGMVPKKLNLLSTKQYIEMREEAFANDNRTPTVSNATDLMVWDRNRYTDWQDVLLGGTANITNIQASLSGGNEQTTYRFGGGYREETTVFSGDFGNKKFSGLLNLNHRSKNDKLKATMSVSFVNDNNNFGGTDLTSAALRLSPNAPELYTENGALNWENDTWTNPLSNNENKYNSTTENLIANANLSYNFTSNFSAKVSAGYNTMNANQYRTTALSSIRPRNRPWSSNSARSSNSSIKTWIVEPQINYVKKIGLGKLSALIGGTFQKTVTNSSAIEGSVFSSDVLLDNLNAASQFRALNHQEVQYKYQATYARINYSYNRKYFLNITGRRDGSSRFGPSKQYANFWGIGAGWIFSEENFLKENSLLSFGKIRTSYGSTGSDQIGDYNYLKLWSNNFYPYDGVIGLNPSSLFNPEYGWETNRKFDVALELGFFDNRIQLNTNYFNNRSGNQLVGLPLPGTTGFRNVVSNLPAEVENTGWEIELQTENIKKDNFSWNSSLNLSILRNKLVEYENLEGSVYANQYVVGEPLSVIKAYTSTGVDPQTGLYTFKDTNGDGIISPEDYEVIGNSEIDFFGGFQNKIRLGDFSVDFLFSFAKKSAYDFSLAINPSHAPGVRLNQLPNVLNRWQQPGDISNIQRFTSTFTSAWSNQRNFTQSDAVIVDASYIRLQNLSIAYDIPVKKEGMHIKAYLQGQNLFTITKYNGFDPLMGAAGTLPVLRQYTLGLQLNF